MRPSREVGLDEARSHWSSLIDEVESGVTIHITRRGRRVAELRPSSARRTPRFGSARGEPFRLSADFDAPLEDLTEYER